MKWLDNLILSEEIASECFLASPAHTLQLVTCRYKRPKPSVFQKNALYLFPHWLDVIVANLICSIWCPSISNSVEAAGEDFNPVIKVIAEALLMKTETTAGLRWSKRMKTFPRNWFPVFRALSFYKNVWPGRVTVTLQGWEWQKPGGKIWQSRFFQIRSSSSIFSSIQFDLYSTFNSRTLTTMLCCS